MHEPVFSETLQVAVVVRDIEAAMRAYADEYGIGPWQVYEFNPETLSDFEVEGKPTNTAWRLAVAMLGNVQWELIEPLDDRNIYAEHLERHGPGLHHVAVGAPKPYRETMAAMTAKGRRVIQSGIYNGVSFAYMSTDEDLGVITEIFDWPEGTTQEPDATYP
jgi:methylmalonyl-CoA/ethylmalonyl-CoA epimerase